MITGVTLLTDSDDEAAVGVVGTKCPSFACRAAQATDDGIPSKSGTNTPLPGPFGTAGTQGDTVRLMTADRSAPARSTNRLTSG